MTLCYPSSSVVPRLPNLALFLFLAPIPDCSSFSPCLYSIFPSLSVPAWSTHLANRVNKKKSSAVTCHTFPSHPIVGQWRRAKGGTMPRLDWSSSLHMLDAGIYLFFPKAIVR